MRKLTYGRKFKTRKNGDFASRLSFQIVLSGKSFQDIADKLKVSKAAIHFWCHGTFMPKKKHLVPLCKFLGIKEEVLFKK